jgi:AcrR family transcriptional regulator
MNPSSPTAPTGEKARLQADRRVGTPESGTPRKGAPRERLMDGMVAAVIRHGYTDASIAQAIAHAHVSRGTFYEHFTDKEDCFLAAYDDLATRMTLQLRQAVEQAPWPAKANAMLSVVLDPEEQSTPRWRLLLSLSRGGSPRVRLARERLVSELEQLLDELLCDPPPGTLTLDVPSKALLGGVRSVLSVRRYQGRLDGGIREQLLSWTRSYAVPGEHPRHSSADWVKLGEILAGDPRPRPPTEPRSLPRGRSRLPAEIVSGKHHDRILRATIEVIRRQGYAASTITDIVAGAHVSRNVFYKLFHDKEDVFIAAQSLALQESVAACSRAFFGASSWPERLWSGLRALLEHAAADPDLAYVVLVEPNAVGDRALQRLIDTLKAFTIFLEEGYSQSPRAEQLPRLCSDAIAGALFELLYDQATHERIPQLPELTPQLAYIALAPFIGPTQATEFVKAKTAEEESRVCPINGGSGLV